MSDLEQRLTDALTDGAAHGAPSAIGLAAAARELARRRRRTRIAGGVALVALAVAVPSAVVATGGDNGADDGIGPADRGSIAVDENDDPDSPNLPTGYHWESWHGVTVQVPNTWTYGSLSDWCADGGELEPRIQRPGTVAGLVLCDPAQTYGISFQEVDNHDDFQWPVVAQDGGTWPEENFVGGRGIGGVLVTVATRKSTVATYVLDSMRAIGPEGDPNGCTASLDAAPPAVPDGGMSVCRYDEQGALEQSELLTGDEVTEAAAALEGGPLYADDLGCHQPSGGMPVVVMRSSTLDVVVELAGNCPVVRGLELPRAVSPDVLYWALSPGWSGNGTNLSLPDELRAQ